MGEIRDFAVGRGITEILHFTTNKGLTGCLHTNALLSRHRLKDEDSLVHILTLNSKFRKEEESTFNQHENWIDYVNLSVSEITTNLFRASLRWHAGKDLFWVIMAFDPAILDDEGVYFSTTNNIYSGTQRQKGLAGFKALFAASVSRWWNNTVLRKDRPDHLTTCEQAEVLYPGQIDMRNLKRVYVADGDLADRIAAYLGTYNRADVEVVVAPAKFEGQGN
ncbi:DarT ssDNA thymidine ADP-ribosyltransferase family protein [Sinorhizobium mexicanum]|uniref:DUF4433 domain-containing protein n=1 Tax=Sinorhizobium mexicanum TaxID=375549 RepID=A0A859QEL9_9HYPH|nr:DarT ssDNA thymidine ADP-ribosyltransferase family protein [Sinorhizobium mexicanum]MBP1881811.1 hypothetical protein [Sinorhizobium mexicanum]QLL61564.1 DUF4433 domain-containing protein [Sinorhizobium mexicanum]